MDKINLNQSVDEIAQDLVNALCDAARTRVAWVLLNPEASHTCPWERFATSAPALVFWDDSTGADLASAALFQDGSVAHVHNAGCDVYLGVGDIPDFSVLAETDALGKIVRHVG